MRCFSVFLSGVKQWEVLAGGRLRLHKRVVRWESRCGSVLMLSLTASESCPCLSYPRNPATLAKDPRDRNRHLRLPGRSMSWLQNWRPAFTAGLYVTPWSYLWLQPRWLRNGAFGPPVPTGSRTAFLKILFYLLGFCMIFC